MQINLPHLYDWQQEVHTAMEGSMGSSKIFVVKAKRQIGKSILAIVELIVFSLGFKKKTVNVVLEPTLNQSRRVYKQIIDLFKGKNVIRAANQSLLTIEFINGSEIIFKSAEQEDALRGFTVTGLLVIDEGAYITDDIYEIVFPTTDANRAPILIISTPLFCEGLFYDLYMKGLESGGTEKRIFSFDWNNYDTSIFLTPENLELYRQTLSPNKFRCDYLGQFITEGSMVFGNIRECVKDVVSNLNPVAAGIDWGVGNNGDDTVLTLMDEQCNTTHILELNNLSPTEQISRIGEYIRSFPSIRKVQVELNSIGSVYFDLLKKELPKLKDNIIGFNTTNESKRRVIEQLIEAFEKGLIVIPDNPKLIRELQRYQMEKLSKGYTYNAPSGEHDDYVISLALVYDILHEVKPSYTLRIKKPKKRLTIRERYEVGRN